MNTTIAIPQYRVTHCHRSNNSGTQAYRLLRTFIRSVVLLVGFSLASAGSVTPAQFAVTEGGSATISIPIQIPRGIGGMEPQLSLNYSSGAGNGLLGVGWSLQGPSAITRCPKSKVTDGERGAVTFTSNDRYCLDGQRLLLIDAAAPLSVTPPSQANYGAANTEYRTERETLSRIKAVGTYGSQVSVPQGFRVETKSGLIMEFGNVLDQNVHSSQITTNPSSSAPGAVATISRWMLRRINDRLGSFVDFEYCKGEVTSAAAAPVSAGASTCTAGAWKGSAPLHYIRYTNRDGAVNGSFGVMFRYETRPDMVQSFHAGSSSTQTQRMTAIQTFLNFAGPSSPGSLVRSYDIYYEPIEVGSVSQRATNASRVLKIQERGSDGVTTLPPVTFKLAQDSVFGLNVLHQANASAAEPPIEPCGGVVLGRGPSLACP